MKYKKGDILLCKKSYKDHRIILEEGESYVITDVTTLANSSDYYTINAYLFYSQVERDKYYENLFKLIRENPNYMGAGMSGISPSVKIEDHFYSISELRQLKLKSLQQ